MTHRRLLIASLFISTCLPVSVDRADAVPVDELTRNAGPAAAVEAVPAQPGAEAELQSARVTLTMRDAPLLQIFKLMSAASPARFRYGAPPDAVVSPALNDELVLPAVEKLLHGASWQMQRDGADLFLRPAQASALGSSFSYWAGARLPVGWHLPPASKVAIRAGNAQNQGEAPRFVAPATPPSTQWKLLQPQVRPDLRPGFQINELSIGPKGTANLRWKLPLRVVPPRAQLLLEVPAAARATFYVNGAPLVRNWSGLKLVDLSRSLQTGDNVLAIIWRPLAGPAAEAAPRPAFALRYEWFFDGQADLLGVSQDDN